MRSILFKLNLMVIMILMSCLSFAQEVVPIVPEAGTDDIITALLNLIKNWKALGTLGAISGVIVIITMLMNSHLTDKWFSKQGPYVKRLLITVLGQVVSVITLVKGGMNWQAAMISGLIASGGAVAIYEALKPLLAKKPVPPVK